jgi:hypothetical membrane protein
MNERARRVAALGGVIGPAAFIAAWIVASIIAPHYSTSDDAISELAAVGTDTRVLMTGGFLAVALGAIPYAIALRSALGGRAWMAAVGTALAMVLLTVFPLGRSAATDHFHGIAALIGYIALAVTPLLAIPPLLVRAKRRIAALGVLTAALLTAAVLLSDTTPFTGLFQRIGLTTGQAWIAGSALAMALRSPQTRTLDLTPSDLAVVVDGGALADPAARSTRQPA